MKIVKDAQLKDYTSLRVGGTASHFFPMRKEADLLEFSKLKKKLGIKTHILGEGTNTIFLDDMSPILIGKMEFKGKKVKEIKGTDFVRFHVCGGEKWDD